MAAAPGTDEGSPSTFASPVLWLVTISCADCDGLLEFITKLLSTGGGRVLDADVMLTQSDTIVLVGGSSSLVFESFWKTKS